ncbi:hypothetical protein GCM10008022_16490 [Paenibacillus hunanensis]|nr:hypothetical protein GCM10008022_16490 [Paenibacillus hunanensis]
MYMSSDCGLLWLKEVMLLFRAYVSMPWGKVRAILSGRILKSIEYTATIHR